ncbi:hypothetical protein P692DRAFT_2017782 [Suillus brevipes Sb2]|nr:hypothetical protein P692DRAFT_2017782 [Suillus brevipes Sb2]
MSPPLVYSTFNSILVSQFSATLPLPRPLSGHTSTQGRLHMNSGENSRSLSIPRSPATSPSAFTTRIHHLSSWWPVRGSHAQPNIVDVPLAQAKEARSVHFSFYGNSNAWIHSATLQRVLPKKTRI